MEISLRKINGSDHMYMAVFKTTFLKGIFSVVFQDNIFGMLTLNQFMEMIRTKFKCDHIDMVISDDVDIKDKGLFNFIMKHFDGQKDRDTSLPKQEELFK